MDHNAWNERLNAIVERLNELNDAENNLEGCGWWDIDIALDVRQENYEGDGDCPPLAPDELEALKAECDRNLVKIMAIDAEKENLISEYCGLTGTTPHRYWEGTGNYARSWHERYNGE